MTLSQVSFCRLGRPLLWSLSSPTLPSNTFSAPPPWHTGRCLCASHLGPSTALTFHTGGTVGGVGCPPIVRTPFPGHVCAYNVLSSPSSSSPVPYTPKMAIPAVLTRLEMTSDTSEDLFMGAGSPTDSPLPSPRHAGFSDAPPQTLQPRPHHRL